MTANGRMWLNTLNNPDENNNEAYLLNWSKQPGVAYVTG